MFNNPHGRTLYEIAIINHANGTRRLLCYAAGTPSRSLLIRALRSRWDSTQAFTLVEEWNICKGKKLESGDWTIEYTGRTEWEAKNTQSTLVYVAD